MSTIVLRALIHALVGTQLFFGTQHVSHVLRKWNSELQSACCVLCWGASLGGGGVELELGYWVQK